MERHQYVQVPVGIKPFLKLEDTQFSDTQHTELRLILQIESIHLNLKRNTVLIHNICNYIK